MQKHQQKSQKQANKKEKNSKITKKTTDIQKQKTNNESNNANNNDSNHQSKHDNLQQQQILQGKGKDKDKDKGKNKDKDKDNIEVGRQVINYVLNCKHSFINRTQFTVVSIAKVKEWGKVIDRLNVEANYRNVANVRCLRIQNCIFNSQILQIPQPITTTLFTNLTKLTLTKCSLTSFPTFPSPINYSPLPNLHQLDISYNNLSQIPKIIYTCMELKHIKLSHNFVKQIDNQLCLLKNLDVVDFRVNVIQRVGVQVWGKVGDRDARDGRDGRDGNRRMKVQWEWNWELIAVCVKRVFGKQQSSQRQSSLRTLGTVVTEADFMNIDEQHNIHPQNIQFSTLHSQQAYLHISKCITQLISSELPLEYPLIGQFSHTSALIISQLQTLLFCEHTKYLQIFQPYLTLDICRKFIDLCEREKKYCALDFMVSAWDKLVLQHHQILEHNQKKAIGKNTVINLYENKAQTLKKLKILQPNNKKHTPRSESLHSTLNSPTSTSTSHPYPPPPTLLQRLLTFNPKHYPTQTHQINPIISYNNMKYILNELSSIINMHPLQKIISAIKSEYFMYVFNSVVTNVHILEELLTDVEDRDVHILVLKYVWVRVFGEGKFGVGVVRVILALQDFQLIVMFQSKYPQFKEALYGNTPRNLTLQSNYTPTIPSLPLTSSITTPNTSQSTNWRFLTRQTSKIYKILLKHQKRYIKHQLESPLIKNLHMPQYIPPQNITIRNDVHDYEILKDYQQFQASFWYRDWQNWIKRSNQGQQYSIAKKILSKVVDQAQTKVRNLGKSLGKTSNAKLKERKRRNLQCGTGPRQTQDSLLNRTSGFSERNSSNLMECTSNSSKCDNSQIKIRHLSPRITFLHKNLLHELSNPRKYPAINLSQSKSINSIINIPKQQLTKQKKKGLILSNSNSLHTSSKHSTKIQNKQNQIIDIKKEKEIKKTVYIDLSKQRIPLQNQNQNQNQKNLNICNQSIKIVRKGIDDQKWKKFGSNTIGRIYVGEGRDTFTGGYGDYKIIEDKGRYCSELRGIGQNAWKDAQDLNDDGGMGDNIDQFQEVECSTFNLV